MRPRRTGGTVPFLPTESESCAGDKPGPRYALYTDRSAEGASLRIVDRTDGSLFMQWHGDLAEALLNHPDLALPSGPRGCKACSKAAVWDIALAAAGISVALGEPQAPLPGLLAGRLEKRSISLPRQHEQVAATVFCHPDAHLSLADVYCLMTLNNPAVRETAVHECLEDLVSWSLLQRIEVDNEHVFYDTDMQPHLHLFDPESGNLTDAPANGVLTADAPTRHQPARPRLVS
ncbi:MAG: hypothetical protein AAGD86_11515 [Pseudomonadota bacterium]